LMIAIMPIACDRHWLSSTVMVMHGQGFGASWFDYIPDDDHIIGSGSSSSNGTWLGVANSSKRYHTGKQMGIEKAMMTTALAVAVLIDHLPLHVEALPQWPISHPNSLNLIVYVCMALKTKPMTGPSSRAARSRRG